ncbi:unnamed protein product, partial [marine sediment metagenome]
RIKQQLTVVRDEDLSALERLTEQYNEALERLSTNSDVEKFLYAAYLFRIILQRPNNNLVALRKMCQCNQETFVKCIISYFADFNNYFSNSSIDNTQLTFEILQTVYKTPGVFERVFIHILACHPQKFSHNVSNSNFFKGVNRRTNAAAFKCSVFLLVKIDELFTVNGYTIGSDCKNMSNVSTEFDQFMRLFEEGVFGGCESQGMGSISDFSIKSDQYGVFTQLIFNNIKRVLLLDNSLYNNIVDRKSCFIINDIQTELHKYIKNPELES